MLFLSGCIRQSRVSSRSNPYQEDLSKLRTHYPFSEEKLLVAATSGTAADGASDNALPEQSATVNARLDAILETLYEQNKAIRFMSGYRVLLYVGNTRAEADGAKSFVYRNFPDLSPYVTFEQPTYRVKIGDFMTRVEAEQVLESVKLQYTTAVIVPDKIEIRKGLQSRLQDN